MSTTPRPELCQLSYEVRLEWGLAGVRMLAAECAAVVVVDVLSFSTAVDVALGRGATVHPGSPDGDAEARPAELLAVERDTRLTAGTSDGARLCAAALQAGAGGSGGAQLFVGCLRNASAVARAARAIGGPVGLVPAGERWPDGTLRVALEDALGAGAMAAALPGAERSPEAQALVDQFAAARDRGLGGVLAATASGGALVADGHRADVTLAAAHDVSRTVARLQNGVLAAWIPPGLAFTVDPPHDGWWAPPGMASR